MDLLLYFLVPLLYLSAFVAFGKYLKSRNQPRYLDRHPYQRED